MVGVLIFVQKDLFKLGGKLFCKIGGGPVGSGYQSQRPCGVVGEIRRIPFGFAGGEFVPEFPHQPAEPPDNGQQKSQILLQPGKGAGEKALRFQSRFLCGVPESLHPFFEVGIHRAGGVFQPSKGKAAEEVEKPVPIAGVCQLGRQLHLFQIGLEGGKVGVS